MGVFTQSCSKDVRIFTKSVMKIASQECHNLGPLILPENISAATLWAEIYYYMLLSDILYVA